MRVLGYGFHAASDALRARESLERIYGLRPGDARVGDLADNGVVLAVRAREDNIRQVTQLLSEHGGRPLVDVDEQRTGLKPRDA